MRLTDIAALRTLNAENLDCGRLVMSTLAYCSGDAGGAVIFQSRDHDDTFGRM